MMYADRTAERLADILGNSGQEEEWTCPADGYVDYYALIVWPGLGSFVVHEDNYGAFTYMKYRDARTARREWRALVESLDAEWADSEWTEES